MFLSLKTKWWNNKKTMWEHGLATLAAVISRLSMLLITLINTQLLSPTEFGLFAVLMLIANVVNAFVSCGGDMWLNRFTRRRHTYFARAPIVAQFYLQISGVLAGFVMLIALLLAFFLKGEVEGQKMAIVFCLLWSAMGGLIEALLAVLRTTSDIHRFFMIRDLMMPVMLMSAIGLLKINTAANFFLMAFILWTGTLVLLLRPILKRVRLYLSLTTSVWRSRFLRHGLIGYTLNLIINNFTARLANGFDTLILTRYSPMDLVGKYRLVAHFSNAFTVVQHFVFLALPWHLRRTRGDMQGQAANLVTQRQLLLLLSATPPLIILSVIARPLLGLLGPSFEPMASLLVVFLIIRFSELLWGPQHEKLISNNKVLQDTIANIIGLIMAVLTFSSAIQFVTAMLAATLAVGFSSIATQLCRYYILKYQEKGLFHSHFYKGLPWIPILLTMGSLSYITMR